VGSFLRRGRAALAGDRRGEWLPNEFSGGYAARFDRRSPLSCAPPPFAIDRVPPFAQLAGHLHVSHTVKANRQKTWCR